MFPNFHRFRFPILKKLKYFPERNFNKNIQDLYTEQKYEEKL